MQHPLIRVILLLVFIAATATARPAILLAASTLLVVAFAGAGRNSLAGLGGMLARLRWLFLAILVVYGWWTPGDALFPSAGSLSPVQEGLRSGLLRVTALVLIVCAVQLLLRTTPRGQLLSALYSLTRPVLSASLRERFAVRVLLTLEAVPRVQQLLAAKRQSQAADVNRLQRLAGSVNAVYNEILDTASRSAGTTLELDEPLPAPLQQWLLPLLLGLAALLLALVG